ncbi:MAG: YciI family protein [Chromatiales bacterium]|nr:YciI family protein [Chromatiales bacterium]
MLYAISGEDTAESLELRAQNRSAHLARVRELLDEGRLVIAGPHPALDAADPGTAGFTGSLIVAEFPSLEEAERWASEDPYLAAGAWARVSVKPFLQVLP